MKSQSANLKAAEQKRQTAPAFLYVFSHNATKYFFTAYDENIIVEGGSSAGLSDPQTFTKVNVDHIPPEESVELNGQPTRVMLAANDTEFRKYFLSAPSKEIQIEIYRVNSEDLPGPIEFADLYLDFKGVCISISFAGYQVDAAFISLVQQQDRQIPGYFYQKTCNVALFSSFCGLNPELHKIVTTCAAVSRTNRTVDISATTITIGSPGRLEDITEETFQGGRLKDSSGNEIGIVACEPITGGTRLWLSYWPGTLAVSSAITIYTGCSKIVRQCDSFYQNKANFRGHPFIPVTNPAVNSIIT